MIAIRKRGRMTNVNKNLHYFCLGILTAILSWYIYTLYYILSKPVLLMNVVDEDAEYEACLKKYAEAVISLEKKQQRYSLDDTQPIRIGVTETIMPEVREVSTSNLWKWAKESE